MAILNLINFVWVNAKATYFQHRRLLTQLHSKHVHGVLIREPRYLEPPSTCLIKFSTVLMVKTILPPKITNLIRMVASVQVYLIVIIHLVLNLTDVENGVLRSYPEHIRLNNRVLALLVVQSLIVIPVGSPQLLKILSNTCGNPITINTQNRLVRLRRYAITIHVNKTL